MFFRPREKPLLVPILAVLLVPGLLKAQVTTSVVGPGIHRIRYGKPEPITPIRVRSTPARWDALKRMPAPDRTAIGPDDMSFRTTARGCVIRLPADSNERFYGLGLHPTSFLCNNTRKSVIVSDRQNYEDGSSHAPVPFYVSTLGYGVFVDTARQARFYFDLLDQVDQSGDSGVTIEVPCASGVDVYLFDGPTLREAVCRYNLFSGGGCLPPMWGLGVYYRGYGQYDAAEVLQVARSFREKRIPCDVFGLEPGWQSHAYSCSFIWSSQRWPDPQGFIRDIRSMGYELNLWEHAFVHPTAVFHDHIKAFSGDYRVWGGLVPDFLTSDATGIFAGYHSRQFVDKGITGFKLDECDNQPHQAKPWSFPEFARFPSGADGEQMHVLFGTAYQHMMADMFRAADVRTYGQVRSSHALAAPLPFVLYSDYYDHRGFVRAILNAGFSGLLWQPEVRESGTINQLYHRTLTAVFSPQTVINAWFLPNPPWLQIDREKNEHGELMPERGEVENNIRGMLELRMRLIPYLYEAFSRYRREGLPPFRAIVMDYPEDPATFDIDDQYMFGDAIMVAPLFLDEHQRSVYFPQGSWYCLWTHKRYVGPTTQTVTLPRTQTPVFVRRGAILPMADPVQKVEADTVFDIRLLGFGPGHLTATLFEDDGTSHAFDRGVFNLVRVDWPSRDSGTIAREGRYEGERYRFVEWQRIDDQ